MTEQIKPLGSKEVTVVGSPAQLFVALENKIFFGFDRSKDHSKTKYFLGFVLVLPKQQMIVRVR